MFAMQITRFCKSANWLAFYSYKMLANTKYETYLEFLKFDMIVSIHSTRFYHFIIEFHFNISYRLFAINCRNKKMLFIWL